MAQEENFEKLEELAKAKDTAEFKQAKTTYRGLLAKALKAMHGYTGTEGSYEGLFSSLIELEDWMTKTFGQAGQRLTPEQEAKMNEIFNEKKSDRSIDAILDHTQRQLEKYLTRTSSDDDNIPEDIYTVEIDSVILPPGDAPEIITPGEHGFDHYQYSPRLKLLILCLNRHGIFLDDLTIVKGKLEQNMIRAESYNIVEIPRARKEVLVCNQVGEATFVIDGIFDRHTLLKLTKAELMEHEGVEKILFKNQDQWERDLEKALFQKEEKAISLGKKIDIKSTEEIKAKIKAILPTSEQWIALPKDEKNKFKIQSMGLTAIARLYEIAGNPISSKLIYYELGKRIYGDNDLALKAAIEKRLKAKETAGAALEQIIALAKALYPTSKEWLAVPGKKRKKIKIGGVGLTAIAGKFGVSGHPSNESGSYYTLGLKIYGENDILLQEEITRYQEREKAEKLSPDEIIRLIKQQRPSSETWLSMSQQEKKNFNIHGLGLKTLATKLGASGNPINFELDHILLGAKIYGEEDVFVKAALEKKTEDLSRLKLGLDKWPEQATLIDFIRKQLATPEDWIKLADDLTKFDFSGITPYELAKKIGFKGNPMDNKVNYLTLGLKIYGEDPVLLNAIQEEKNQNQALEKAALIASIKLEIPTGKDWFAIPYEKRKDLEIAGLSLYILSNKFGLDRNAGSDNIGYYHLAAAIYGAEDEEVKKRSVEIENLIKAIKITPEKAKELVKQIYTAEEWVAMTKSQKQNFELSGMTLYGLAKKLGLEELTNASSNHLRHYRLGAAIFGEDNQAIQEAIAREEEKNRVLEMSEEAFIAAIKAVVPTASKWIAMTQSQKAKFKILGLGLKAMVDKLGLTKNLLPVNRRLDHCLLGQKIYGEDNEEIKKAIAALR